MTDYRQAIWSPNNNFDLDQGAKDHIVIHGTAGGTSAEGIAQHFRSTEGTNNPVSTQYIIDQVGTIIQTVLEKNVAYGNGTYDMNIRGISIEHVKSATDNSSDLTDIQKQKSFDLIKDIRSRHNIPIENIVPHSAVVPTACPGPYPWDEMRTFLGGQDVAKNTVVVPTQHQIKAALDCWSSVLKLSNGGTPPTGTGIYESWLQSLIEGKQYGPPISHEYDSVNWDGKFIVVQEFAHARAEYDNGVTAWYSFGGPA